MNGNPALVASVTHIAPKERIVPKKILPHLQTALRKLHRLTLLAESACEAARTPAGPTYLTESELGIRLRGIHQELTRAWNERRPRRSGLASLPTRSF